MRLEWSRRAELDLRDGITFIAKEDPQAADAIEDRILEAASGLMTFPESGRTGRRTGTRELVVRRTPDLIVYRVRTSMIQIVRIWHMSREPFA